MLLNRDVATLQKHLKGKLPSRENVQKLLKEVVITNASQNKSSITKASITCESDHRMSSQKLALKLQHEEMDTMQPQTSKTRSTMHSCIDLTQKEETEEDSIFDLVSSTVGQNEENLEFEADAAAALLQVKCRRS